MSSRASHTHLVAKAETGQCLAPPPSCHQCPGRAHCCFSRPPSRHAKPAVPQSSDMSSIKPQHLSKVATVRFVQASNTEVMEEVCAVSQMFLFSHRADRQHKAVFAGLGAKGKWTQAQHQIWASQKETARQRHRTTAYVLFAEAGSTWISSQSVAATVPHRLKLASPWHVLCRHSRAR